MRDGNKERTSKLSVFIVTESDGDEFDYSAATAYGEIKYVFDLEYRNTGKRGMVSMRDYARAKLDGILALEDQSSAEKHYMILNPGPLLNNAIAASLFTFLNDGVLTLLAYNPSIGAYSPIDLQIDDTEGENHGY